MANSSTHAWSRSAVVGTLCGLASSVGYTAANVYLRSAIDSDPILVSCVKAVPTLLLALPWTLWIMLQGKRVLAKSAHLTWELVAAGLIGQLFGNVAFQWALGVIGMAMCVPICLGAMILASGMMGRRFLNEQVTLRDCLPMGTLVLAVAVLSSGAADAHQSVAAAAAANGQAAFPWWYLAAGVAATIVSGVAYAFLGVVIRRSASAGAPASTTLLIVSLVGFIGLGATAWLRLGADQILATSTAELHNMLWAGVWNAVAFVALTQALRLTPVMYVNGLNATQTGLAGLAGVFIFGEAATSSLLVGVGLTLVGLMLMGPPKSQLSPGPTASAAETA